MDFSLLYFGCLSVIVRGCPLGQFWMHWNFFISSNLVVGAHFLSKCLILFAKGFLQQLCLLKVSWRNLGFWATAFQGQTCLLSMSGRVVSFLRRCVFHFSGFVSFTVYMGNSVLYILLNFFRSTFLVSGTFVWLNNIYRGWMRLVLFSKCLFSPRV